MKRLFWPALIVFLALAAIAQQSMRLKRGTIWVSFEQDGKHWMIGALKDYASCAEDPERIQTDFKDGYCVKVCGADVILFHNCCTTNIIMLTNYTGTVEIAGRKFTVEQFLNK